MMNHVHAFIKMPTAEEAISITKKFQDICGIPQVLLTIDNTHVPINAPMQKHSEFVNKKGWTSFNAQIIADCNYM